MKTLNVRLTPEDSRAVRVLRDRGCNVSELIRTHLRAAAAAGDAKDAVRTPAEVDALFEQLDGLAGKGPRSFERAGVVLSDRKSMRAHIRQRVARKGRGKT